MSLHEHRPAPTLNDAIRRHAQHACAGFLSSGDGLQTLLVPQPVDAFECVQFVAAVVETDAFHLGNTPREGELRVLNWVMEFPFTRKAFQRVAICYLH